MAPSFKKGATVRFDVGGHHYTVSRSLLELYPDSMLARLVSDEWNESNDDGKPVVIFIDRSGRRFEYVLDYMRDHEVNLPMTESIEAVKKELAYYGLMTASSSMSPSITGGSPAEAGRIMAAMGGNMREERHGLDQEIQDLFAQGIRLLRR